MVYLILALVIIDGALSQVAKAVVTRAIQDLALGS
jgi:hypothetical protein